MAASALLAHGNLPGLGDWLNGVLHPLRSPAHVLLLLAVALLLGQARPPRFGWPAAAVAAGAGLGIGLAAWSGSGGLAPAWLLVPAAAAATAVAFEAPAPAAARAAAAGVAALLIGLHSAPDAAVGVSAWKVGLATWFILPVLVVDLAFYASLATAPWAPVGLRVLASWLLAVCVLAVAFALRPAG